MAHCVSMQEWLTAVYTSVKIIKNEVGCRDDTVPKTVDIQEGTARRSESMQQSSATPKN